MDRPTNFGKVRYLTTVRPHPIRREPQLIDPYVKYALTELHGPDVLQQFEGYTRSFYTLEGHYENLWNYDVPEVKRPNTWEYEQAFQHARDAFRLDRPVTSLSWEQLGQVPFIPSSSAGYGYIGKKGDDDNHHIAIGRAVYSLQAWLEHRRGIGGFKYTPHLAWTRTQLGTFESPKIRHVWGEAFHNIILEGLSASPLIAAYAAKGKPMVVGIHMYHRLPEVIQHVLGTGNDRNVGIGTDLKQFDARVRPWLIRDAFSILRENIDFPDKNSEEAFNFTVEHFIRKPVVMPDGRMWLVTNGVPSGSYYTQMIDSVCNYIAVTYAQLRVFNRIFETFVLGDDSVFGIPEEIFLHRDTLIDELSVPFQELGMILSIPKTVIATRPSDLEFLGHVARGLTVDRDLAKVIRLALYPEQPVTRPSLSVTRIKGLLIDTALQHQQIIDLYRLLKARFSAKDEDVFPHEDANWLISVMHLSTKPTDLDLVKIWTIT